MSWQKWFLVSWLAFGALIAIGQIGKKKAPTTPGTAVVIVLLQAGLVALVLTA